MNNLDLSEPEYKGFDNRPSLFIIAEMILILMFPVQQLFMLTITTLLNSKQN